MKIVNTGRCHIVRMYNTMYSADSMELISIVVYTLGCAIAPVGRSLTIIPSHGAALGSCVLTNINTISGEILADTENSNEIRYEVAHKR